MTIITKKLLNNLNQESKVLKKICNSWIKKECPLENNCKKETVFYRAKTYVKESKINNKTNFGISSLNWKSRYYNPQQSFNKPLLRN